MEKDKKELVKKFLNGELNSTELKRLRELQAEDDDFRNGFEMRKAIAEVNEIQTNMQIHDDINAFLLNENKLKKKKWYFLAAASIIGLVSLISVLLSRKNKTENDFSLKVNFYQTNFGSNTNGQGFSNLDSSYNRFYLGKVSIKFLENAASQDSSYQIIDQDSLNIKIPKITMELDTNTVSVIYDYNLRKQFVIIKKDTFELKESKTIEKLIKK